MPQRAGSTIQEPSVKPAPRVRMSLESQIALLRKQAALATFGELALRSDDTDEVLTEACRLVGQALGTDLAKVVELQADGHTLIVRAGVGWKAGVIGVVAIEATESTSEGHALRTGEPMISRDIKTETRFKYSSFLIDNGVRAIANVAIIGGQGRPPFGILQIDSRKPRQFTDQDIEFLRSYANLIAAAVDRLRVSQEVRLVQDQLRAALTAGNISQAALEIKVAERTRDLTRVNARLRAEAEERERIEGALRQTSKMEAVGQLTGGLAHDFNNMLTSICGNLEFLAAKVVKGHTSGLLDYINAAQGAATRASALTHRLLAFSRRQTLDPKFSDIGAIINDLEQLLRRAVGPLITIEILSEDELWSTLVDQNQIENAILNLCLNARDAMPNGGAITIGTRNHLAAAPATAEEEEEELPAGQYVSLYVSDNGSGMAPETVAHAFEPFFTTKPLGSGTGLGLSMVYGFVKQSGGRVHITSKLGVGTSVTIYLPRSIGDLDGTLSDLPGVASDASTVLIVDDEPDVRRLVSEALKDAGYNTIQASDGASGVAVLKSDTRIDFLITDIGLPGGMNGRQVATAAREWRGEIKVLFITGYAEPAILSGCLLDENMQLMTKPFEMAALAGKVGSMIGG